MQKSLLAESYLSETKKLPAKVTHQRKNKQRSAAEKSHLSEKVDFPTRCGGFFIPLRLK